MAIPGNVSLVNSLGEGVGGCTKGRLRGARAVLTGETETTFVTPTETNVHGDALCFMVQTRARHKTTESVLNNVYRSVAVRGWRSAVGGRRLAVGGWRLVVGGWRLAVGGRRLAVGGWRLAVGGRRLAVGGRRLAVGGWRSAVGGWRSAVGGWRLAVGGPWGLSLRAVLNQKKIGVLKDSPGEGWGW